VNGDNKTPQPIVRTSAGQTDYKRELAYARLGINRKDVRCIPFLAAEFRRIARSVRGADFGNQPDVPVRPLDYLQFSEDPQARKVLNLYLSVPRSYRRLLPAEAFCHAAGVSPFAVLEAITVVAMRHGAIASAFVAAVNHPRVVAKTVEMALQDDGVRERMILHKALGFLPRG